MGSAAAGERVGIRRGTRTARLRSLLLFSGRASNSETIAPKSPGLSPPEPQRVRERGPAPGYRRQALLICRQVRTGQAGATTTSARSGGIAGDASVVR